MTAIASHLLANGHVDGVVVTSMRYGQPGPRPYVAIARSDSELRAAQGSKYAPVPALAVLPQLRALKGRYAFVGTPCQVAAVRALQRQDALWRDRITVCIANFCGGFRDLRETDTLIRRAGMQPGAVTFLRYRGGGQPGSMLIRDTSGGEAEIPYPHYARRTGFIKHRRCRLCVDATAELADFACGDAWLPRFQSSVQPWSLVLARSMRAREMLDDLHRCGLTTVEDVTPDEVCRSQAQNLASKKTRQEARRTLSRWLRLPVPDFDGGWPRGSCNVALELKVALSHNFIYFLERMGVYPLCARLAGRYR
jgi:coenzyme F420 hydrogenase subunit beta